MSASVYSSRLSYSNNLENNNIPSATMFTQSPTVHKVKRMLFGPVDHKTTQQFIDEELSKIIISKSELWNFDFTKERTLNHEGAYEWRPTTPSRCIRPIKRRAECEYDSAELYCDPCETEIIRPSPVKRHAPQKSHLQSHITDYMKATKRTLEVSKKLSGSSDWNNPEPPHKIARTTES